MSHSIPINPSRAYHTVTARALKDEGYDVLVVLVDKHVFIKAQWGTMRHGTLDTLNSGREDREIAPDGSPAGHLFYLMTKVPTRPDGGSVPGIPPHMYSDAAPCERGVVLNRMIKDQYWVWVDVNFAKGKPLSLTGGGVFITDQPIAWQYIKRACDFECREEIYSSEMSTRRFKEDAYPHVIIRCGASQDSFVRVKSNTGTMVSLPKWTGSICGVCINNHIFRQGVLRCPDCHVQIPYWNADAPDLLDDKMIVDEEERPGQAMKCIFCSSFAHKARDCPKRPDDEGDPWPKWAAMQQEAEDTAREAARLDVSVPPPPPDATIPPVIFNAFAKPSAAASSSSTSQLTPRTAANKREQEQFFAQRRRDQKNNPDFRPTPFEMDRAKQQRAARQKGSHQEKWNNDSEYRMNCSLRGKTHDSCALLTNAPWVAHEADDEPPTYDMKSVELFRTAVVRYKSHVSWRQLVGEDAKDPPDHAWLKLYWDKYIKYKPATAMSDEGFGPLGNYVHYDAMAAMCYHSSVGGQTNRNIPNWSPWEDFHKGRSEEPFWDPITLMRAASTEWFTQGSR